MKSLIDQNKFFFFFPQHEIINMKKYFYFIFCAAYVGTMGRPRSDIPSGIRVQIEKVSKKFHRKIIVIYLFIIVSD